MADTKRSTRSKEIVTTVEEEVIVLTLTLDEAAVIRTICGKVTGDVSEGPRFVTRSIWEQLGNEGISPKYAGVVEGQLRFPMRCNK